MFKFVFVASLLVSVALAAPLTKEEEEEQLEVERRQNENAQYQFNSAVDDGINDGTIQREEERNGTKVKGSYSYSDGYVRRKVYYEADENGYRVVKEETEDIGNGPVFDDEGSAKVKSSEFGEYSIKLDKTDDKKHYKGEDQYSN